MSPQIFIEYPRHLSKKLEQMLSTIRHIFQVTAKRSFFFFFFFNFILFLNFT